MSPLPIVLLVDDLAANRDTLRELLGEENYEFVEVPDGELALALAAANPPDLVLLDVLMPGMDGFEVCRRLRAAPPLAEVPVIMVTALDDRSSRLAGIEAGADDFVSKPFDRVELCARVRTITRLNRHRRLAEQRSQFQWVVEHATDGYLLVNAGDEILFANARARRWLGLVPDWRGAVREKFLSAASRTFLGKPEAAWVGWPQLRGEIPELPRLLVRPETALAHGFVLEVSVHENTGSRLLRLSDVGGRIAAQRDKRAFQAMVQHKLLTPLNGILGPLELLAMKDVGGDPADTAVLVAIARGGAERLATAVEDVLRFADASRVRVGDAPFPTMEFAALVEGVSESLHLPATTVTIEPPAADRSFPCNRETLEWVLLELLENARKFHPRQMPTVEVNVGAPAHVWLELTIGDDGITLSPDQLARIGCPFFQGEKYFTGEAPGMGLGLASVFALVWQTGGSCSVRNRSSGPGVVVELRWLRAPGEGLAGNRGTMTAENEGTRCP